MAGFNNFSQEHSNESQKNTFESSKEYGAIYASYINSLIGKENVIEAENLEGNFSEFVKTGDQYFQAQSERFKEIGGTAEALLSKLPGISSEDLADTSKFELSEPYSGVFILKIDEKLLTKIQPNATAVAVKVPEGISFVLVPIYDNQDTNEMIWKENIPHEVHHLFWKGIMDSGLLVRRETDPDFQKAFAMYQDELIARMCSNGGLSGYSHLSLLDPESKDNFKRQNPENFERITEIVSSLNDFLSDLSNEMRVREIKGESLIGAVSKSKSFVELESALDECREFIIKQPITNPDKTVSTGWDFV